MLEMDLGKGISLVLVRQFDVISGESMTRLFKRAEYLLLKMQQRGMLRRSLLSPSRLPE